MLVSAAQQCGLVLSVYLSIYISPPSGASLPPPIQVPPPPPGQAHILNKVESVYNLCLGILWEFPPITLLLLKYSLTQAVAPIKTTEVINTSTNISWVFVKFCVLSAFWMHIFHLIQVTLSLLIPILQKIEIYRCKWPKTIAAVQCRTSI